MIALGLLLVALVFALPLVLSASGVVVISQHIETIMSTASIVTTAVCTMIAACAGFATARQDRTNYGSGVTIVLQKGVETHETSPEPPNVVEGELA